MTVKYATYSGVIGGALPSNVGCPLALPGAKNSTSSRAASQTTRRYPPIYLARPPAVGVRELRPSLGRSKGGTNTTRCRVASPSKTHMLPSESPFSRNTAFPLKRSSRDGTHAHGTTARTPPAGLITATLEEAEFAATANFPSREYA